MNPYLPLLVLLLRACAADSPELPLQPGPAEQDIYEGTLGGVYELELMNPRYEPTLVRAEVFGADGPGSCTSGGAPLATILEVIDFAGGSLAYDEGGGVGGCSRVEFLLGGTDTVWLNLSAAEASSEGLGFLLAVELID